jgi:hypothetical protein
MKIPKKFPKTPQKQHCYDNAAETQNTALFFVTINFNIFLKNGLGTFCIVTI